MNEIWPRQKEILAPATQKRVSRKNCYSHERTQAFTLFVSIAENYFRRVGQIIITGGRTYYTVGINNRLFN